MARGVRQATKCEYHLALCLVMGGRQVEPDLRRAILDTERVLIDEQPAPVTLRGDDHHLTYDENGYPELPACLDRRPKLEQVVSNPSASQPLTEAA